ncbi:MAG: Wzz/FepE/Etk N-terminal domain-containing protein [Bacilli bacterium]|nr:Wzz/FepE/Etk N-terminal domain-containing protein [Bacilli bacterium]
MDEKIVGHEHIEDGITLVDLFNALKQNIVLLLLIGIVVVGIGAFYTWFMVTPMYSSSIDIQISNAANENVSTVTQVRSNVKEIVKYDEVIEEVIVLLDIEYTDIDQAIKSIKSRISSSDIGSASAVRVTYEDVDPIRATKVVIALAQATADRVNIPKGQEGSLAFASENLVPVNIPRENPNKAPSSPNKMLNLAISVILGGIIGVVIVILKEQFSRFFKSGKEVEKFTNIKVIALIPEQEGVKKGE